MEELTAAKPVEKKNTHSLELHLDHTTHFWCLDTKYKILVYKGPVFTEDLVEEVEYNMSHVIFIMAANQARDSDGNFQS